MKKKGNFWYLIITLLVLVPFLHVQAKSLTVNSEDDFTNALADSEVDTIILNANINTTKKINITRPVTIDGNNHTMTYTGTFKGGHDNTVWDGIYVLQIYKTSATIKNIKLTGANAALLVNGGTVHLEGNIDVSGNGFGGIELSQGQNVTEASKAILDDNTELINTTDSKNKPTVWVPSDSKDATFEINGLTVTIKSGEELSIKEVEDRLETINPKTFDSGSIYFGLALLSLSGLALSYKKLINLS